jgi:alkylhydroperoxidase family enzyme
MTANTLAQEIEEAQVAFSDLEKEYRPMLRLVEQMIGVVPNCDPYLEIWPSGFKTYNLLVANLLNMPQAILGQGAPKDLVGLSMYAASRAAECMYCSAHTCSFALRRGVSPEALVGQYSPVEAAVVAVAEGMSRVPDHLAKSDITELRKHIDDGDVEWVVLGAALMGFLNKFMDTMGIELEQSAIDDVSDLISATGWTAGKHAWSAEEIDFEYGQSEGRTLPPANGASDSHASGNGGSYRDVPKDGVGTYLRVLKASPAALRKDLKWTKGMSARPGLALLQLEEQLGYAYTTLASLNHNRAIRSIATVIRDNMNAETTTLGLGPKCLIALVYARVVGNEVLTAEAVQMAERLAPEIGHRKLTAIGRFAAADLASATLPPGLSTVEAAVVMLTKAAAPSPSEVNQITIATATESLTPAQIVEAVVWLSVQQLLHRLYVFYEADNEFDY